MNRIFYLIRLIKILFIVFWHIVKSPKSPWKESLKNKHDVPLRTNQVKHDKNFKLIRAQFTTSYNESGAHGIAELIEIHAMETLSTPPQDVRLFRTRLWALINICIYADICAQKIENSNK